MNSINTKDKKAWWKNAIAYQIYPRSFKDTNGDGIGDIPGIIEKLDYLKDLGIDLLWICPVYKSPMDDNGYDISDYYDIDPVFGTKEDMDCLLEEAHKCGIRILMDLVINHCSDEHPWFQKALADPNCEEAEYFYFRTSKNGPPNNWRSMFGGSAWENAGGNRWYLHLFGKKQPDLNWENPKLRDKLYEMVNYWLDKGLGGYRIDAITHIKKEPTLSSLPPDGPDGMTGCCPPTRNYPGIGKFLVELREKTFDKYDCMTVAEAAGIDYEDLEDYIGKNGYFDTLFDFTYSEIYTKGRNGWYDNKYPGEWPTSEFRDLIFRSQVETQKAGWAAVYFENHDYPRSLNKFIPKKDHNFYSASMLGCLYFFLRGIPFIYQGQELGMTNICMDSIDEYNDIATKNNFQIALDAGCTAKQALIAANRFSRDNARIPFPWNCEMNAGFTTGKPWLKIHPDYLKVNAEAEMNNPDSVYSFYKKMIMLRKHKIYSDVLGYGDIEPCMLEFDEAIAYFRKGENVNILVLCSFLNTNYEVTLPCEIRELLLNNYKETEISGDKIILKPYQAIVAQV